MTNFKQKIDFSKKVIRDAIEKYPKIGVACSFGKDSMVIAHLAREVDKNIPIFSVMTIYKPTETLKYLVEANQKMNLGVKVYIVADEVPQILKDAGIETVLLPTKNFKEALEKSQKEQGKMLYDIEPDSCCNFLKVEPIKEALKNFDAWIAGLRRSEGETRADLDYIIHKGNIVKINPILDFNELDVWRYLALYQIPSNPLYKEGYRSLGCAPCSKIVADDEKERAGRWLGTNKCGGECGIHSKLLK
ncbi:MAG: phosphoadenosine phosphosulfate reductase family protein [Candidatus Nealsonbacteria bacterium]